MRISINVKALGAFRKLGAVALITATIFFVACNQTGGGGNTGGGGGKPKHAITFSVDSTTPNGTLKAKVDGGDIASGNEVEEGKTVTFTAKANDGYRVKGWTLDGKPITEAGTNTEYKLKVSKPATVKVSFEAIPPTKYTVTLTQTEHGKVTASPEIPEDKQVLKDTEITFTAKADDGYKIGKWTVTPAEALQAGGADGSETAKVKITADTTVSVSFIKKTYAITFSVDSTTPNGILKAKAEGITETGTSPITVEHGKEVTFTATADDGYRVKGWTLDGNAVNGTNSSYSFPVTKAAEVKVSFENTPPDVGSFEDTGDGFIKIIPPANGIAGVAPDSDYALPGNQNYWKGVFIKDRKVKLSPYKLGKTEVTYKLWKEVYDWAVKAENGYKFANEGVKGSDGTGNDEEQPVTTISWRDCIVWCNAYTAKTKGADTECVYRESGASGAAVLKDATAEAACNAAYADMSKKGFRLPTEAEWEYAARRQNNNENAVNYGEGGSEVYLTKLNSASGAKKPIGFSGLDEPHDSWDELRDEVTRVAVYKKWFAGNNWVSQPTAVTKTAAVKSKAANAIGLYDMSGNVWEWCFDWYGDIEANTVTDPQGGASGTDRVLRGGSWYSRAFDCTVGRRYYFSPGGRNNDLGFRLGCRP